MKTKIQLIVVILLAVFLLTFKILQVPPGIETDEGSIAHNAALISKTLHDQNNRLLPFFVLSIDKIDWKQPVLIYLTAIAFKLFGTSLLVFKYVNITVSIISLLIMAYLTRILFSEKTVPIASLIYITTPIIIICSRIGTETILPVLFGGIWILSLSLYRIKPRKIYIALAAFSLGIGLYSFKGMRIIVPPWVLLTIIYIFYRNVQETKFQKIFSKKFFHHLGLFILIVAPFFLIIPLLESKYPGAVFDRRTISISLNDYRHHTYYWLSNLGLGFLFLRGDIGKIYSVELYGSLLLGALPFFLIGIKQALNKISFFTFILVCYLATPILFGFAGSMGYGHRLVAMVPFFVILTTLGFEKYFETISVLKTKINIFNRIKKLSFIALSVFFLINFIDFFNYYYFEYPKLHETRINFSNNFDQPFNKLAELSKTLNYSPYVEDNLYFSHGEGILFFEAAYFNKPITIWKLGQTLPSRSILLTKAQQIENTINVDVDGNPINYSIGAEPLYILKSIQ